VNENYNVLTRDILIRYYLDRVEKLGMSIRQ